MFVALLRCRHLSNGKVQHSTHARILCCNAPWYHVGIHCARLIRSLSLRQELEVMKLFPMLPLVFLSKRKTCLQAKALRLPLPPLLTPQRSRTENYSDKATEHCLDHLCDRASSFECSSTPKQAFIGTWQIVSDQPQVDLTFEQSVFERSHQLSPFPTSRSLGEHIIIYNGTGLRTYITSAACKTSEGKE